MTTRGKASTQPVSRLNSDELPGNALQAEILLRLSEDAIEHLAGALSNQDYLTTTLKDLEGETAEALADLGECLNDLVHLVGNQEALAGVLAQNPMVAPTQESLTELLATAEELCAEKAKSARIFLRLASPAKVASLPIRVHRTDALRAMTNLIRNSIFHSPAGTTIVLSAGFTGPETWMRVADEGQTLDSEEVSSFTLQGQFTPDRGPRYGRGMALFIAKAACNACEAQLSSFSLEDGTGNCFEIRFSNKN